MKCHACDTLISDIEPNWLECNVCKNYYHMSCTKRECTPGAIYGDVFFTYTCSECTSDHTEEFVREKMIWIQVIVLVLYHLQHRTLRNTSGGFFHWRTHIVSYIAQKWDILFPIDFKRKKNWTGTVSGCLSHYSTTFLTSGLQIVGEAGWWKLTFPELTPKLVISIHSEMVSKKFHQNKQGNEYDNLIKLINKYAPHVPIPVKTERVQRPLKNIPDDNLDSSTAKPLTEEKTQDSYTDLHHEVEITKVEQESHKEKESNEKKALEITRTLFSKTTETSSKNVLKKSLNYKQFKTDDIFPLKPTEENLLLKYGFNKCDRSMYALKRKLSVRSLKRKYGMPLFNLDIAPRDEKINKLDRFSHYHNTGQHVPKEIVIAGGKITLEPCISPYTHRLLRPFIRRDFKTEFPWLKMMAELQLRVNKSENWKLPPRHPVDFCYVRPHHIAAINTLCERHFWPGIDCMYVLQGGPKFRIDFSM